MNQAAEVGQTGEEGYLIVDDNETFLRTLERGLMRRGHQVGAALGPDEAMCLVRKKVYSHAIVDLNLGAKSGLTLIPQLLDFHPSMQIVVLTGYASIATAVEAIRLGAINYLPKPVDMDDIFTAFRSAPCLPREFAEEKSQPMSIRQLEWEYLQRVLLDHEGNISATARALGLHRRSLQRKLKKHAPT